MLFFFQAEDGIRDLTVTGVQTCALPICPAPGEGHGSLASGGNRDEGWLALPDPSAAPLSRGRGLGRLSERRADRRPRPQLARLLWDDGRTTRPRYRDAPSGRPRVRAEES